VRLPRRRRSIAARPIRRAPAARASIRASASRAPRRRPTAASETSRGTSRQPGRCASPRRRARVQLRPDRPGLLADRADLHRGYMCRRATAIRARAVPRYDHRHRRRDRHRLRPDLRRGRDRPDRQRRSDPNVVVELGIGTGTDPTAYTYAAATPNLTYGPGSPNIRAEQRRVPGDVDRAGRLAGRRAAVRVPGVGRRRRDLDLRRHRGGRDRATGSRCPACLTIAAPYFSEYLEGMANSSNKAVEIYNPGSIPFPRSPAARSRCSRTAARPRGPATSPRPRRSPPGASTRCARPASPTCPTAISRALRPVERQRRDPLSVRHDGLRRDRPDRLRSRRGRLGQPARSHDRPHAAAPVQRDRR